MAGNRFLRGLRKLLDRDSSGADETSGVRPRANPRARRSRLPVTKPMEPRSKAPRRRYPAEVETEPMEAEDYYDETGLDDVGTDLASSRSQDSIPTRPGAPVRSPSLRPTLRPDDTTGGDSDHESGGYHRRAERRGVDERVAEIAERHAHIARTGLDIENPVGEFLDQSFAPISVSGLGIPVSAEKGAEMILFDKIVGLGFTQTQAEVIITNHPEIYDVELKEGISSNQNLVALIKEPDFDRPGENISNFLVIKLMNDLIEARKEAGMLATVHSIDYIEDDFVELYRYVDSREFKTFGGDIKATLATRLIEPTYMVDVETYVRERANVLGRFHGCTPIIDRKLRDLGIVLEPKKYRSIYEMINQIRIGLGEHHEKLDRHTKELLGKVLAVEDKIVPLYIFAVRALQQYARIPRFNRDLTDDATDKNWQGNIALDLQTACRGNKVHDLSKALYGNMGLGNEGLGMAHHHPEIIAEALEKEFDIARKIDPNCEWEVDAYEVDTTLRLMKLAGIVDCTGLPAYALRVGKLETKDIFPYLTNLLRLVDEINIAEYSTALMVAA